jgi:hypothetical protein
MSSISIADALEIPSPDYAPTGAAASRMYTNNEYTYALVTIDNELRERYNENNDRWRSRKSRLQLAKRMLINYMT